MNRSFLYTLKQVVDEKETSSRFEIILTVPVSRIQTQERYLT